MRDYLESENYLVIDIYKRHLFNKRGGLILKNSSFTSGINKNALRKSIKKEFLILKIEGQQKFYRHQRNILTMSNSVIRNIIEVKVLITSCFLIKTIITLIRSTKAYHSIRYAP